MFSIPFNSLAQRFLPDGMYRRLAASDIAKRLARGSAWSIFGSAISRLLVLLGMILLARILGQTAFGEFGMIQATLGVGGMMAGFGLGSTATRFVAQHSTTAPDRAGRIIALVGRSSWVLILMVSLIIVLGSGAIASNLLNAPHLQTELVLGTFLMAAVAVRGVQNGVLAGLERFDIVAKLNLLEGIASCLGLVVLAMLLGVEGALLGLALGSIVTWLVGRRSLHAVVQDRGISVSGRGSWREKNILTGYSFPNFIASSVATPVLWYCMTVVAERPEGYDELALYHAAYQWHGPMVFIPMVLMSVSIPILVQEWEAGRQKQFRKVLFTVCVGLLAIAVPAAATVSLFSPWIMSSYGTAFQTGWPLLILLVMAAPLHGISKITTGALLGMNLAWWVFITNAIWALVLVSITMWLVPSHGSVGLAIAFLIAHTITVLLKLSLVAVKSGGVTTAS